MVSPYFFFQKNWRPFSIVTASGEWWPFLAVVSPYQPGWHPPTGWHPIKIILVAEFRRKKTLNSATKIISVGCHPLERVTRGGPPALVTPLSTLALLGPPHKIPEPPLPLDFKTRLLRPAYIVTFRSVDRFSRHFRWSADFARKYMHTGDAEQINMLVAAGPDAVTKSWFGRWSRRVTWTLHVRILKLRCCDVRDC